MDLLDDARAMGPELAGLRRALHAAPEVGLELPRTQERVLDALAGLPLEISMGTATTSVTAVLRGGRSGGRTVLLRGDMDALPLDERSGEEFAATNGTAHACGHDLHTAGLVGAVRLLAAHRDRLAGDVVFMFQPGEEGWAGARVMLDEGVLDAAGRPGVTLAASFVLDVTVRGAGGHGAMPHHGRDPVTAAAAMVIALQTAITRSFDVFDPVILSVGVLRAGTRRNVIPDTASFEATVRAFSPDAEPRLREVFTRCLEGVARAHGVAVDVTLRAEYPATVNDPGEAEFAAGVVRELLGEERYVPAPTPFNASEDFSMVLNAVPGVMFMLGACPPGTDPAAAPGNHSPLARFDDAVLPAASALLAGFAAARLGATA